MEAPLATRTPKPSLRKLFWDVLEIEKKREKKLIEPIQNEFGLRYFERICMLLLKPLMFSGFGAVIIDT